MVNDSSIEIYKTLDENLQNHGIAAALIPTENDLQTRAVVSPSQNFLGQVQLWDDKDFDDRNYTFGITDAKDSMEVENLNDPYKFNDKCSSLILTNYLPNDPTKELDMGSYTLPYSEATLVFIGYENHGYRGSSFTVLAESADPEPDSRRKLPKFNDKMSSFKLFFAAKGKYSYEGFSK